MRENSGKLLYLLVIVITAFLLRLYGVGDIKTHVGDEGIHIPAVETYQKSGHSNPDYYWHPPLKYILLHGSMELFGDNPYGWRLRNIFLGTLSVALVFLIGKELFSDIKMAFLAAILLSVDPLHVLVSRTTLDEVPAGAFFLASLYFAIRYLKGGNFHLVPAGIFIGLSLSMKWYFAPSLPAIALFLLLYKRTQNTLTAPQAFDILAAFIVLPLAIYLLIYAAWFERGYGLLDFIHMQIDAYRDLQLLPGNVNPVLSVSKSPWEWFLKPVVFGSPIGQKNDLTRFFIFTNNPPVWMMTMPAMIYMTFIAWKSNDRVQYIIPFLFLAAYIPLLFVKRSLYLYSAIPCLPLAILAISSMSVAVINRFTYSGRAYTFLLIAMYAWGLYLYPLISMQPVPPAMYESLLTFGNVKIPY